MLCMTGAAAFGLVWGRARQQVSGRATDNAVSVHTRPFLKRSTDSKAHSTIVHMKPR